MSATVLLACGRCGCEQYVPLDAVLLVICTDDPALNGYRFPCEQCGEHQDPLSQVGINTLRDAGARQLHWSKRNLPSIPPSVQALPPLTLDDVITAHFTLPAELDALPGRAA